MREASKLFTDRPPGLDIFHTRGIKYIWETVFIKRGPVKVNFYTDDKVYLTSREFKTGDVIRLASDGLGFVFLEETEMIKVKHGHYCNEQDKGDLKE
jgi:hypothetical protein